jgi:hypothetical protein
MGGPWPAAASRVGVHRPGRGTRTPGAPDGPGGGLIRGVRGGGSATSCAARRGAARTRRAHRLRAGLASPQSCGVCGPLVALLGSVRARVCRPVAPCDGRGARGGTPPPAPAWPPPDGGPGWWRAAPSPMGPISSDRCSKAASLSGLNPRSALQTVRRALSRRCYGVTEPPVRIPKASRAARAPQPVSNSLSRQRPKRHQAEGL